MLQILDGSTHGLVSALMADSRCGQSLVLFSLLLNKYCENVDVVQLSDADD